MRTLAIVLVLAATPALAETPKPRPVKPQEAQAAVCRNDGVMPAGQAQRPPARTGKLGEMPRARMELTVLRRIGACTVPMIVSNEVESPRQ